MRLLLFLSLSGVFVLLFFRGIGCVKKHRIVRHIPTQPKTVKANYVLITASEGFKTSARVRVSYSRKKDAAHNEVVTEEHTTPFFVGGYEVVVLYDSLELRTIRGKKETIGIGTNLLRDYEPGGSDYFEIKHLSGDPIEYAIATEGHWQFFTKAEFDKKNLIDNRPDNLWNFQQNPPPNPYRLADGEDLCKRYGPHIHGFTPIHYETNYPIIYLLRPELAPEEPLYVGVVRINGPSDVLYIKLCRSEVPKISLEDIMLAYRQSAKGIPGLRGWYRHPLSSPDYSVLNVGSESLALYGKIGVGQTLRNALYQEFEQNFRLPGGNSTVSLDRPPAKERSSRMLILGNGFYANSNESTGGGRGGSTTCQ